MTASIPLPKAFIARRLHSLTGLFITLYLIEHLLVNSQAALWIGDDGSGFVRMVNSIQDLPFLPLIEIFLLGVPILIHMWWGIQYLHTSAPNSWQTDGSLPALPEYPRNHAYTWQRITSWILLVGIIAHVAHMRFYEHPASAQIGTQHHYMVRLDKDAGLDTLAPRMGFKLLNQTEIEQWQPGRPENTSPAAQQAYEQRLDWIQAVRKRPLKEGQVIAVTDTFGMAELLMVRETFKMPLMLALYTIFVLSACFHGFNGLWTFMISWGVALNESSQRIMRTISTGLMVLVASMGLAAIWGTYWINLKH